ncbi:hypothetical protein CBR_g17053 [Chara braunii]|uniref:Uncharacterized protein n=1 Tax=Chara braunii TaxID=69332 RepID=A0A388KUP0_CHABU|nr:hypothetical protein CBR_g17053 [Chara braunii]|eukprot:GBG73712.1 hypothetical protein CBR_g17053 [Chara braunii]
MRTAVARRFALLEERLSALTKAKEEAEANAELWKAEALRPGNKRGSIAVGQTPISARVRQRSTPSGLPTELRVNPQLKGIVERHNMEVDLLKEIRLKDVNGRIEAEKEVERLKEAMAKFAMEKERGTNLKSRLDEVTGPSARKVGCSSIKKKGDETPGEQVNERETFAKAMRKQMKKLNKDQVMKICNKEGVIYTKLEQTKEEIIC